MTDAKAAAGGDPHDAVVVERVSKRFQEQRRSRRRVRPRSRRRAVRLHRTRRRRQDDALSNSHDAPPPRLRRGSRARRRRRERPLGAAPADRLHARALLAVSRPERRGEPAVLRVGVRDDGGARVRSDRADLRAARAVSHASRGGALRRDEAEARALLRARPPPEDPLSRRADDGRRRRVAPRVLGAARQVPRRRPHDSRVDAVHGRSRPLRPRRAHAARARARHRHAEGHHGVVRAAAVRGARREPIRGDPRAARVSATRRRSIRSARRCTSSDARADAAPDRIASDATDALRAAGIADASVSPTPATIEDVFMARMGAPEGEESSAPRGNAA